MNLKTNKKQLKESTQGICRHCGCEYDIDDCDTNQYWTNQGDRVVYHVCPECGRSIEEVHLDSDWEYDDEDFSGFFSDYDIQEGLDRYSDQKPSSEQFSAFVLIQRSGITNMLDVPVVTMVADLMLNTPLSKENCRYIYKHYDELMEEYKNELTIDNNKLNILKKIYSLGAEDYEADIEESLANDGRNEFIRKTPKNKKKLIAKNFSNHFNKSDDVLNEATDFKNFIYDNLLNSVDNAEPKLMTNYMIRCSKSAIPNALYYVNKGEDVVLRLGNMKDPVKGVVSHVWVEHNGDIAQTFGSNVNQKFIDTYATKDKLHPYISIALVPGDVEASKEKIKNKLSKITNSGTTAAQAQSAWKNTLAKYRSHTNESLNGDIDDIYEDYNFTTEILLESRELDDINDVIDDFKSDGIDAKIQGSKSWISSSSNEYNICVKLTGKPNLIYYIIEECKSSNTKVRIIPHNESYDSLEEFIYLNATNSRKRKPVFTGPFADLCYETKMQYPGTKRYGLSSIAFKTGMAYIDSFPFGDIFTKNSALSSLLSIKGYTVKGAWVHNINSDVLLIYVAPDYAFLTTVAMLSTDLQIPASTIRRIINNNLNSRQIKKIIPDEN